MSNPQTSNNPLQPAVLATEQDLLRCHGFVPPPLDALDDAQLRGHLWELIYALAAQKVYLRDTDPFSDRELYRWLQDDWLARARPNQEADSATCRLISLGADRSKLAPHDSLMRDRDRFLPCPPIALRPVEEPASPDFAAAAEADSTGGERPESAVPGDPLGLAEVDREIRIEQMKSELEELGGETFLAGRSENCPPAIEQAFLEHVLDIEKGGWERPLEQLNRQGVVLPPPDELTDPTVGPKLWELLHELACRGFYVLNSDHLGDRELYAKLWREDLREPAILPGRTPRGGWFHDFVGSGSPEHIRLWLRYYADDEARDQHTRDWPAEPLPPRETPPFNRDWRLPKGPF